MSYINRGNGMNTWREKMKLVLCFTSIMGITLKEFTKDIQETLGKEAMSG
jgi:hypothetical protein